MRLQRHLFNDLVAAPQGQLDEQVVVFSAPGETTNRCRSVGFGGQPCTSQSAWRRDRGIDRGGPNGQQCGRLWGGARGAILMLIITVVSIVGAVVVMRYYVVPWIIRPLESISKAMTDLAAGDTSVDIPGRKRSDELGRMAQALGVFRDTAIEVQKSNLREIAEARRRLSVAIESISEACSLYDDEDRLVACNSKYRTLIFPNVADESLVGMTFETLIRRAAEHGDIEDAQGQLEEWVEERLARHRNPTSAFLQRRRDGRWVIVSERKTDEGGTVAVYSDVTELKQREEELSLKTNALEQLSGQLAKYLSPQVYEFDLQRS